MTESEWLTCEEPDLLLEVVERTASRERLVDFVRQCWARVGPHLPDVPKAVTVADEFAALAPGQSDHDAVLYAAEAALKAAGWAPNIREEQRHQSELLRKIVGNPFSPSGKERVRLA